MSETNKKYETHRLYARLSLVAPLVALISWQPTPVAGQDLSAYGADMCAEIGIPADQCALSTEGGAPEASETSNDKTATLVEHGRRLCEQQGVPIEDCKALPTSQRRADETVLPAASFLTVPDSIPAPDPGLVPPPVVLPPPVIVEAPVPARPSAPPVAPPLRYASPQPVDPGYRYVEEPRMVEPGPRYVQPDLGQADFGSRTVQQPIEPSFRAFRQPRQAEPDFRFEERRVPMAERPERIDRFERRERIREEERALHEDASSDRCCRCSRAVRYSRPPSYRYVTC